MRSPHREAPEASRLEEETRKLRQSAAQLREELEAMAAARAAEAEVAERRALRLESRVEDLEVGLHSGASTALMSSPMVLAGQLVREGGEAEGYGSGGGTRREGEVFLSEGLADGDAGGELWSTTTWSAVTNPCFEEYAEREWSEVLGVMSQ